MSDKEKTLHHDYSLSKYVPYVSTYNPHAYLGLGVSHSIPQVQTHHVPVHVPTTTTHHFDVHSFQARYTPYVPYKSTYVLPDTIHVEAKVEEVEEVAEVHHVEEVKPVEVHHVEEVKPVEFTHTTAYTHYPLYQSFYNTHQCGCP